VVLPVSDHVAERIDKLNAVPADAHRHYPQPGKSVQASQVEEGEHGAEEEYLKNSVNEEELRIFKQVFH